MPSPVAAIYGSRLVVAQLASACTSCTLPRNLPSRSAFLHMGYRRLASKTILNVRLTDIVEGIGALRLVIAHRGAMLASRMQAHALAEPTLWFPATCRGT